MTTTKPAATPVAPSKTGGSLGGHLVRVLLALAILDGVGVSSGIVTGQPRGDASYAVYAFGGTVAVWLLAGRRLPVLNRLSTLGWVVAVASLAALHAQAAIAAVKLPAAWPVPADAATVLVVFVLAVCMLALLFLRTKPEDL